MSFPTLPGYLFAELLGKGTYAKVYKAFRKDGIRECVAIKCVSRKFLNQKASDNLVTEIGLMKTISHENIVQFIDFTWDAEFVYIITEFCSGGDLLRLIRKRRCLREPFVRRCLQQLARALHYLYSRGILHMDLKPQNILLTDSVYYTLKLADFGFAQFLSEASRRQELRGSPLYMAPEMYREGRNTAKCDLWSVGIILYECLFGQAPFASQTYEELEQKILAAGKVELPKGIEISEECQSLLLGLLQREPEQRLDHEAFFAHPFVDLDHAPSPESIQKATVLLSRAEECEKATQWGKALANYNEGLTHMVSALHYEKNTAKKEEIRRLTHDYMARAEKVAQRLSQGANTREIATEPSRIAELQALCPQSSSAPVSSPLNKCVAFLENFYNLINSSKSEEAFEYFTDHFSEVNSTVQEDPDANRRRIFHRELSKAMTTAEELKVELDNRRQMRVNRRAYISDEERVGETSCSIS